MPTVTIDPAAQRVLDDMRKHNASMPADQSAWLTGYRAQLASLTRWQGPCPDAWTAGTRLAHCEMRLIRPREDHTRWPTLLFLHGGGFVAGTLDAYEIPLRWLALRSGWQIAAPQYRLAPQYPYPAAPDDCLHALQTLQTADHVDPARIVVAGDSAGGLLSVVTTVSAGTERLPVRGQILLYPNTDLRPDAPYPSRLEHDGIVIQLSELYRSLDLYAGPVRRDHARLSPIFSDFSKLPPTLLITNECDPLRDEAEALGARIRQAGNTITHRRMPGMIHGALQYAAAIPAADILITELADWLNNLS